MSESAVEPQPSVPDERVALGQLFKREREKRGMSVLDMANELKVLSSAVKGIEDADYASIRAEIFVRGYIKSYATFLGMDVKRCLAMYGEPPKDTSYRPMAKSSAPPKISESDSLDTLMKIVVPLVIIAVVWFGYRFIVQSDDGTATEVVDIAQPIEVEEFEVDDIATVDIQSLNLQHNLAQSLESYDLVVVFNGSSTISISDDTGSLLVDDQLKRRGDLIELTGAKLYSLLIGYGKNVVVYYQGKVVEFEFNVDNPVVRLEVGESDAI